MGGYNARAILPRGRNRTRRRLPARECQHLEPVAWTHGPSGAEVSRPRCRFVWRGQEPELAVGPEHSSAAECFIDYWMGRGAWKRTPEQRRPSIAASLVNVRRWGHALFTEPTPLEAFRALDVPVLYMVGKRTTTSARGVARLLATALPRVELLELDDLGHMGPITHPDLVNDVIAHYLERH